MKQRIRIFLFIMLMSSSSFAQEILTGVIKGSEGTSLPGATVHIKGTSINTASDSTGKFSIPSQKELPFTLVIQSLGYEEKEIQIYELPDTPLEIKLVTDNLLSEVVITSRRRKESAQNVPIPIAVVTGALIEETGGFNVNRIKELVPTVQLYSSNPRNTALNVRGLGSTFGLTNDGIDPGVGFYVDGVYYARPAAATLDFIDVEQIEVLRGPQGTLFGKNTTAGAFNITTRRPSFTPGGAFELSYGNYGFIQGKASVTGPVSKHVAVRLSFSGTQRDGTVQNVKTGKYINDLNNIGGKAQVLYKPSEKLNILVSGDISRQRPDGYAQVVAGVVETKRAAYRQFNQIIADLNYKLPSENGYDRKVDQDTPWRSDNDLGGASVNLELQLGPGTLTSTSAWRYWLWKPSNDRDFTGLPVLSKSQATSKHQQWSQEIRYAGKFTSRLSGVIGVFVLGQELKSDPVQIEESGSAQWRFSQSTTSNLWKTPGLFNGYGIETRSTLNTLTEAVFAQVDWEVIKGLHVLPGIRLNHDEKKIDYNRQTYGGLNTTDPALIALKKLVYTDQAFQANAKNDNISGQLTLSYKLNTAINTFVTYSTSYKPVGVNLGGLPTDNGVTMLELATVKPEYVAHFEAGTKTSPTKNSTLNLTFYNTEIKDYQTLVQTPQLGVNRGYLANAERVRVIGLELEGNIKVSKYFSLYGAVAFTEGKYIRFNNAPVPLEETGATVSFKDISGGALPGISKWAGSLGGEVSLPGKLFKKNTGKYFLGVDAYYRTKYSSSPSPSQYLNINEYGLVNARLGFRVSEGTSISLWARNLLDQNYYEQLLVAAGNSGQYAGVLGDPRTYGITLKQTF